MYVDKILLKGTLFLPFYYFLVQSSIRSLNRPLIQNHWLAHVWPSTCACFFSYHLSSPKHIDQSLMCEVAESKRETKLVNICKLRMSHMHIIHRYGCFRKQWYPRIIHFNRVFHYFHHPFGVFPYFRKHPCIICIVYVYTIKRATSR